MEFLEGCEQEEQANYEMGWRDAVSLALGCVVIAGLASNLFRDVPRLDSPPDRGSSGPVHYYNPYEEAKVAGRYFGENDNGALRLVQNSDEGRITFNFPVSSVEAASHIRGDEVVPGLLEKP